jgi:outer membrane protein assembly factor BamB
MRQVELILVIHPSVVRSTYVVWRKMMSRVFAQALLVGCLVGLASAQCDWSESFKLTASDAAANDNFGASTSISGSRVLVGADRHTQTGAAYVFDTLSGAQLIELVPDDARSGDNFGRSVALDGSIALVGSQNHRSANITSSGAAYLFDVTTGTQLFELSADDPSMGAQFGWSVALQGDFAVVGAYRDSDSASQAGAIYVFDTATGQQLFKLVHPLPADGDNLGWSVAIDGNTVIGSATHDDGARDQAGAVHAFDATTGAYIAKLTAEDGRRGDSFGQSVAIDGSTVLVGASGDAFAGLSDAGSVYMFDVPSGNQILKIIANDSSAAASFGIGVALRNGTAAISAWADGQAAPAAGALYIFDASNGHQLFKLFASDAASGDRLGFSVSYDGNRVSIGANHNDDVGTLSGSAYIFKPTIGINCAIDLNEDCQVDFYDIQQFLTWFAAADPRADMSTDGVFDLFDVQLYLDLYSMGCP